MDNWNRRPVYHSNPEGNGMVMGWIIGLIFGALFLFWPLMVTHGNWVPEGFWLGIWLVLLAAAIIGQVLKNKSKRDGS